MRDFLIACGAFLLILASLIVHTVIISGMTGELKAAADALPEEEAVMTDAPQALAEQVEALNALWDRTVPYLSYTVSYAQIDRADEAVAELEASVRAEDGDAYLAASAKCRDMMRRIHLLQSVSLSGLF